MCALMIVDFHAEPHIALGPLEILIELINPRAAVLVHVPIKLLKSGEKVQGGDPITSIGSSLTI